MRSLGRAVAVFALLGGTAAWGQQPTNDSPAVSGGWQRVPAATAVGGVCYMARNHLGGTKETASWSLQAPAAGDYQIQVYVPPMEGQPPPTRNATYVISRGHGGLIRDRVDQSLAGWQSLGLFRLAKGGVSLTLTDRTGEPEGSRSVVANAAKLVPAGEAAGFSGTLAASDLNKTATAGDVVTFDIRLTNSGKERWFKDPAGSGQTPVRLALTGGPAPLCANVAAWEPGFGWLPRSRERVLLDSASVGPGETGSFLFSLQLAQNLAPGTYAYRFRPVAEPSGAAGGQVMTGEIAVNVTVAARPQNELDYSGLQLYRANLSAHTANSDGNKLIDLNLPTDRSPNGALSFAKGRGLVNVLGLTDHGEELNPAEWAGQADAVAGQLAAAAGTPFFLGLRGFKWTGTTGPHDFFGFPWEGSPADIGHLSFYGTSVWTGTRAADDGAPPQLTPQFVAPATPDATLLGAPTSLADWLWVNGYPRPNAVDNGVSPGQFNHPSLFFRSSFFNTFQYEPDLDRFLPLLAVGTGEFGANYTQVPNLASQISDKGGYRFQGPDTPAEVNNKPPSEILALPADILATLGNPQDMTKWGTNPNNRNRYWFETALGKGWHVGPTINGDNHAGCYCDEAGYTGVWAKSIAGQNPAQAQATVLQALRERAVFASEDRGLAAQFSVFSGGTQYRMGQRNVPFSNAPRFRLDLTSAAVGGNPADVAVKDVFIVTNDGPVRVGGNLTGATARIETTLPINQDGSNTERWFYALVVQNDDQRLLTAPVWMSTCCPPPTCKVWPTEGKTPGNACTVLGFMSTNGTSATLQIDNGAPFPVPLTGSRPILFSELNPSIGIHTATFRVTGPCGMSVCAVQFQCGPPPFGENGSCVINVSPDRGDCATRFVANFSSSALFNTHLTLDGVDLGAVPPSGSRVLPSTGSGTHTVKLVGSSGNASTECQATFIVSPAGEAPSCRNSVTPSLGSFDTLFDLCFFAGNTTRVDVFVDGVLKCTQLNPVPGTQYNCFVRGSDIGAGVHVASIIATGCGGTCQRGTIFRVLEPQSGGKK